MEAVGVDQENTESLKPSEGLSDWDVEDANFWARTGRKIAFRNLVVSIPCLLLRGESNPTAEVRETLPSVP